MIYDNDEWQKFKQSQRDALTYSYTVRGKIEKCTNDVLMHALNHHLSRINTSLDLLDKAYAKKDIDRLKLLFHVLKLIDNLGCIPLVPKILPGILKKHLRIINSTSGMIRALSDFGLCEKPVLIDFEENELKNYTKVIEKWEANQLFEPSS